MSAVLKLVARTEADVRRLTPSWGHYWIRYAGPLERPVGVASWDVALLAPASASTNPGADDVSPRHRGWHLLGNADDIWTDEMLVNYEIEGPIAEPRR